MYKPDLRKVRAAPERYVRLNGRAERLQKSGGSKEGQLRLSFDIAAMEKCRRSQPGAN